MLYSRSRRFCQIQVAYRQRQKITRRGVYRTCQAPQCQLQQARGESRLRAPSALPLNGTTEWYDFFIYGTAAAVVFAPQFFPQVSRFAGTLAAFATFAVGFVARPLGGIVMGHFGDRLGRKSALVWCLMLMGLSTFAIGLLPNYA